MQLTLAPSQTPPSPSGPALPESGPYVELAPP